MSRSDEADEILTTLRRWLERDALPVVLELEHAALENSIEALRIHAACGYSTEDHIERYYRDAPLLCIGEGTNEIQRLVIARQLTPSQEAR